MTIWRRLQDDRGTSMLELMMGMVVMVVFMAMFTGAIYMMNNTQRKTESVSATAAQLNQAFLTLDRSVRYADAISTPAKKAGALGDWYVELRSPTRTKNVNNPVVEMCTQLRVDVATQQLQKRTWLADASPPPSSLKFMPVASEITNGNELSASPNRPFIPTPPSADTAFQQLTFNLISKHGLTINKTESRSTVTFTAVNSTIPPPSGAICGEDQAVTRP